MMSRHPPPFGRFALFAAALLAAAMFAVPVGTANASAAMVPNLKAVPTAPLGIAAETQMWVTNNVSPAIEITAMTTNTVQTLDFKAADAATMKIEMAKTVAMKANGPPATRGIDMVEFVEVQTGSARGSPAAKMTYAAGSSYPRNARLSPNRRTSASSSIHTNPSGGLKLR